MFFLLAQTNVRGENLPGVLTNAAQVKALSVAAAAKRIPVKLQGVATGEGKTGIFIQDDTPGIFVYSGTNDLSWVKRGDLVEISNALFISEDTVKYHLKTLFTKLGVQDRTEAAINAIRHGIVHLEYIERNNRRETNFLKILIALCP